MADAGLAVNIQKCEFEKQHIDFLGHSLSKAGITPLQSRVQFISDMPTPTNCAMLRSFIGGVGFYHWMIPNLSRILSPLHELVAKHLKHKTSFMWSERAQLAFEEAKAALCSVTRLQFPNYNIPFQICTDASELPWARV